MNKFPNAKLLTIDDEPSLRRSIKLFFEDSGFTVFEAADGPSGIQMARKQRPHIVLVDLRMPEMNGLEVIRILSKECPEVPIIVVSGTGVLEDALEAIRAGASDYITKPINDMQILEHTVHRALEKAALLQENRMYQEDLEQLVKERTNELIHSQKMEAMGTLAGGIAHDFNNILTGILGYNELAQMCCSNPTHQGYLKEVEKAGNRAKDLVQQILTFSRKRKKSCRHIQVSLILKDALKLLRASMPSSIEIKQEIISGAKILADPSQIQQIIINLCTNGFQAMEEKGGILSVSLKEQLTAESQDSSDGDLPPVTYLVLTVSDTGQGMDNKTTERIFEPYFTTKGTGSGTGLGLAVVHGIVGSCNGDIVVQSSLGQGTTFRVFLPISDRNILATLPPRPKEIALAGKERVLFVDDEPGITELAELVFTQFGYQINSFSDPEEALASFHEHPDDYDILISDMTMPKMSGDKLVAAIKKIRPAIPVFICSGYAEAAIKEKTSITGVSKYINKPLVMTHLLAQVRQLFDT